MASDERTGTPRLIQDLVAGPRGFSFFQAVRLLEASEPERPRVGRRGPVRQEAVRFRPNLSFGFPGADVERVEHTDAAGGDGPPYRMTVNFLGLYGASSPLPAFITEDILAVDPDETAQRDFLDLFHHRLISLFYRCWRKYRHQVQYLAGARDETSGRLYALAGLGMPELRDGLGMDRERLLSYLGLLALRGRSPAKIAGVLSDYLGGVPVAVESFVPRTVALGPAARNAIGRRHSRLGRDFVLGAHVRDIAGKFRVVLGPMTLAKLRRHLPGAPDHAPVRDLVGLMLREPLAFDVTLRLRADEVPRWDLDPDGPCRLGWTTWLGKRPRGEAAVTLKGTAPAAVGA
jgi:type VI secretion system protein ImpH